MSTTTLPPRTHPVLDALRGLHTDLAVLSDAPLWTLADNELLAVRVAMQTMAHQFTAACWAATREIDTRGSAVAVGATSTRDWLAAVLRRHPADATREVGLAARSPTRGRRTPRPRLRPDRSRPPRPRSSPIATGDSRSSPTTTSAPTPSSCSPGWPAP